MLLPPTNQAGKKKPQRVDYDELFKIPNKRREDDWYSGITAMTLEDEDLPPHKRRAAAAGAGGGVAATRRP
jgi:hypothetical protein